VDEIARQIEIQYCPSSLGIDAADGWDESYRSYPWRSDSMASKDEECLERSTIAVM